MEDTWDLVWIDEDGREVIVMHGLDQATAEKMHTIFSGLGEDKTYELRPHKPEDLME